MSVLYRADPVRGRVWKEVFAETAPDLRFQVWPENERLEDVEYLVAWAPPPELLAQLPRLKVLFSTGAGIDHIAWTAVPPYVSIVRMVEPGLVKGMVEYITLSVLALHRNLFDYMQLQGTRTWKPLGVVAASERTIGVMGLGVLGQAVLARLKAFDYTLHGWARSPREIAGVTCHAGPSSLPAFLADLDVLVCLLPLTPETQGLLNHQVFSRMKHGAAIVNGGRGAQLNNQDLLKALDSAQLSWAVLDVFDTEPLPPTHPFWTHPRVIVTPHIAGETMPRSAAPLVIENIRRHQRGEPLRDRVDRSHGY